MVDDTVCVPGSYPCGHCKSCRLTAAKVSSQPVECHSGCTEHVCRAQDGTFVELVAKVIADNSDKGWGGANFLADKIIKAMEPHLRYPARESITPTEEMCDRARGFIMARDLGVNKWHAMQSHLLMGGYPSLPRIAEKAASDPNGHITKWDVAECIYMLMNQIEDGKPHG